MSKELKQSYGNTRLDVEAWEILALNPMTHWCFGEGAMRAFVHNEAKNHFSCLDCGHVVLLQQLIIEGRLSESKYQGIASA